MTDSLSDTFRWFPRSTILKYSAGQVAWARQQGGLLTGVRLAQLFPEPEDGIVRDAGNGVTAAGLASLARVIAGEGGHPLAPGRTAFGVGADGATEFHREQGHLSRAEGEADGRSYYRPMDPGYPKVTGASSIEGQATFTESEACFDWHEWCWAAGQLAPEPHHSLAGAYGGEPAVMVNRRCSTVGYGAKEMGVAWCFKTVVDLH